MRRALRAAPPLPEPAAAAAAAAVAAAAAAAAAADADIGPPAAAPAVEGAAALDAAARGCGNEVLTAALDGWSVVDGDSLSARLLWLCGAAHPGGGGGVDDGGWGEAGDEVGMPPPPPPPPPLPPLPLLQLHESGAPLQSALQGAAGAACISRGSVLLFGDHVGYTPDEEAAVLAVGGVRCALGQVPLLTSQCIVIAHYLLDAANSGPGPAAIE